jgi:aminopeptidase-like protein
MIDILPGTTLSQLKADLDSEKLGFQLHGLASELYPFPRSITGNGVRQTLTVLQQRIPLQIHEVPSGTEVFDWTVPQEWTIRDAYVKNAQGDRLIDFQKINLHVLNFSVPIHQTMGYDELKSHLFTLPDQPDLVPYRTSYYNENWGFCLSHHDFLKLSPDEDYEVCIDADLKPGFLTYGEYVLPGQTEDEILLSCHLCHPSLANDNLSGLAIATYLANSLSQLSERRYTYRFLFIPGTIGSITWLALNESQVFKIKHGLVLTCLGDPGKTTYKKSRRGDAEVDRAAQQVLKHSGQDYEIEDFFPYGYDERQYCSPGFNLAVGCLMRSPHGTFPEYHTSADNLDFITPNALVDSFIKALSVIEILEHNATFQNQNPKGEPRLGKRDLYKTHGGEAWSQSPLNQMALLWVLNLSDGDHSLLDIAERSQLPFSEIKTAADALERVKLLSRLTGKKMEGKT